MGSGRRDSNPCKDQQKLDPSRCFGAALIARSYKVEEIAKHGAVFSHTVENHVGIFGYSVAFLIIEYSEEIIVHFVEELRSVYQRMVAEVDIVPVVCAEVPRLPIGEVGVAASCRDFRRHIDTRGHFDKSGEKSAVVFA